MGDSGCWDFAPGLENGRAPHAPTSMIRLVPENAGFGWPRYSTGWPRCSAVSAGSPVREDQAASSVDSEPDSDFDPEERKS
ncbi:MAG: hypothetical protein R6Y91_00630 [Desulfohalobium sp.]